MGGSRTDRYEVVITGGGYAGLAAGLALGPRALLIEQHEIGAIQHSACAIPLDVARRFDVEETVIQAYPDAYIHTPHGTARFTLRAPYCIFDHAALCRRLFARSGVRQLRARVIGLDGSRVLTSAGPVEGELLIDATGWPGALVTARRPEFAYRERLTVGVEAEVPGRAEGLHFYLDASIVRRGYAWLFPAGDSLRLGVASYDRQVDVRAALDRFLRTLGYDAEPVRGGMIPWFRRIAVDGNLFVAGDAAGHCLPLTAEGIRFALHFGALAGEIARQIADGQISLAEGRARYRAQTEPYRRRAAAMRLAQATAGTSPDILLFLAARLLATPPVRPRFLRGYDGLAPTAAA